MAGLINSMIAAVVYLVYVGSKPTKTDTITETRIRWNGFGDKQLVPADKASILLQYKDVWVTEDQFAAGVESGIYKKVEFASDAMPQAEIEGIDFGEVDDDEGEDLELTPGDDAIISRIQEAILATASEEKPALHVIRAALPELTISVKQLNAAWKELGGK